MADQTRRQRVRSFLATEYGIASVVFLVVAAALILIRLPDGRPLDDDLKAIWVEAVGFLFDIVLFGMLIAWFRSRWERREQITRYEDQLNDFRFWDEPEGVMRKVGIIKRLVELGRSDSLSLNYMKLQNARFSGAELRGADLSWADLSGADFYETDLSQAILTGAKFANANLLRADISGADLSAARLDEVTGLTAMQVATARANPGDPAYLPDGLEQPPPCPD